MKFNGTLVLSSLLFVLIFGSIQCQSKGKEEVVTQEQALVDAAEEAMGGRDAYDKIKYLTWNFFGSRKWWWNKETGDVRCESQRDSTVFVMNINTMQGKYRLKSLEITEPDTLKKYLLKGKSAWINDSYWLVMPFKLEDPGTNLKYLRQDTTLDGRSADLMELTFNNVGVTPQNKYVLYFDQETKLLSQWDFYGTRDDEAPRFQLPWKGYESHQGILFSPDRGRSKISEIGAPQSLPEKLFKDLHTPAAEILKEI